MVQLIILRGDGSIYWVTYFSTKGELNMWLTTEQKRPYWDKSFTTQIIDNTPLPPTAAEIAAEQAKAAKTATLKSRLEVLGNQSDMTAADIKESIMKWLQLQLNLGRI